MTWTSNGWWNLCISVQMTFQWTCDGASCSNSWNRLRTKPALCRLTQHEKLITQAFLQVHLPSVHFCQSDRYIIIYIYCCYHRKFHSRQWTQIIEIYNSINQHFIWFERFAFSNTWYAWFNWSANSDIQIDNNDIALIYCSYNIPSINILCLLVGRFLLFFPVLVFSPICARLTLADNLSSISTSTRS